VWLGRRESVPAEMLAGSEHREPHRTSKPVGRFVERLRDSLWIAWTLTFLFNWVAFLWIGFRARNGRWLLWSFGYAIPFIAGIALTGSDELYESWPGDLLVATGLSLGVLSIIHALRIRRAYITRRRSLLARRAATAGPPMGAARRTLPSIGIVCLYLAVGSLAGGVVLIVVLQIVDASCSH
jgi:hypothetical protein